ncbi:MAG TPA: Ig-like domain-containing protein [Solirubrobacteraceae bacterium]|nr:Ig-like domain-containing protein [Solirubrobacteraceae bacterium]
MAGISLVAMAVGPVGSAGATLPDVTIASPLDGSVSNNQTPSFSGLAEEVAGAVTLTIYEGPNIAGRVIQESSTLLLLDGAWSIEVEEPLEDGTYTVQATQSNLASEVGSSAPVTFTVDTSAPTVTLNRPESPSHDATPSFTGTASDITPITVRIHAGATTSGTVVSTATAAGTGAGWSTSDASPALPSGEYTALATQASSLGNPPGRSDPVTFAVTPTPAVTVPSPAPPVASFTWFPSVPRTGETVSLVSSSTDATSPITAIAWALTSGGPFQSAGAVLSTSFSTPGAHSVQLRVTNAEGLLGLASETIHVVSPTLLLMQPFPVVRIAGTETAYGVNLKLLEVQQTPAGARITLRCKGRGCPIKLTTRVVVAGQRGVAPVKFRRFERSLPSGLTLEILVSKPGEIGKYTRFMVRRGKLPKRVDMCLEPASRKPLVCPSS